MTHEDKKKYWERLCKRNHWAAVDSVKEHYLNIMRMLLDDLRDKGEAELPEFGRFYLGDIKGITTRHNISTGEVEPLGNIKRLYFVPCAQLKKYVRRLSDRDE